METATDPGRTMRVNGADIYYEGRGEGEPLVLLHGFTGCGRDWKYFPDVLGQGYRLIVPDIRGHGRSTNPSTVFEHRQCALDIFSILDQLGVDRFRAVGVSLGGNTLLHMATQQPNRVEAMVVAHATSYFPQAARAIMREFTVETRTDEEWRVMRDRHVHGDDQIRALWRQANAFKDSYDDMSFTPPSLARITARTLIVAGDSDPFYPLEIPVAMHSAIPGASLWILPNSGHGAIFGEREREWFAEIASRFLRGS